jgi:hypothetical protein
MHTGATPQRTVAANAAAKVASKTLLSMRGSIEIAKSVGRTMDRRKASFTIQASGSPSAQLITDMAPASRSDSASNLARLAPSAIFIAVSRARDSARISSAPQALAHAIARIRAANAPSKSARRHHFVGPKASRRFVEHHGAAASI